LFRPISSNPRCKPAPKQNPSTAAEYPVVTVLGYRETARDKQEARVTPTKTASNSKLEEPI
jgi:hypothetical protein